jgi:hypothetical protein
MPLFRRDILIRAISLVLGILVGLFFVSSSYLKPEIVEIISLQSCEEEIPKVVEYPPCDNLPPIYSTDPGLRASFRKDYVCPINAPTLKIVEQGEYNQGACYGVPCHHDSPKVDFSTGCGCPCEFVISSRGTEDTDEVRNADVVIRFFDKSFVNIRGGHKPEQIAILFAGEASAHYPAGLTRAEYTQQYNYSIGHRPWDELDSFTGELMKELLSTIRLQKGVVPISYEAKQNHSKLMSVWITNCGISTNRRMEVLNLLLQHGITIDSFGSCMNNALIFSDQRIPISNSTPLRYRQKIQAAASYMFLFAAENADCPGYHTEKIFHALAAGAIPVYLGATTLPAVVPDNSYIHYRNFSNVSALAAHMMQIATDRKLYESYHAWRKNPFERRLVDIAKGGMRNPRFACEICLLAHQRPKHTLKPDHCQDSLSNSYFN